MAFENSQAFFFESTSLLGVEQFESSARAEVSLDKPIKKVVSVSAKAKITNIDKNGESTNCNGKTLYQVVYQGENNQLYSALVENEWTHSLKNTLDNSTVSVKVLENTLTASSSTEVAISSILVFEIYAVKAEKVAPIDNLPESYVQKTEEVEFYNVVGQVNQIVSEVSECEVEGKVQEVVYYDGVVNLKSVQAAIDTVSFEGQAYVTINTIVNDSLVQVSKVIDFKQEVNCLSALPNNVVDASAALGLLKCTASVNETDNKTNIVIALDINLRATVYNVETKTILVDAFSTQCYTECVRECVAISSYNSQEVVNQTLSATIKQDNLVKQLCFITSLKPVVTDFEKNEQKQYVKGNVEAKYIVKLENNDYYEQTSFIPFVVEFEQTKVDDVFDLSLKLNNARLNSQNEVEISYDVMAVAKKYQDHYISYLANLVETEQKEQSDCGIKVLITRKGEDLFAVSKALSVRPEVVLEQNPNLEENFEPNTRIVVYSRLDANF